MEKYDTINNKQAKSLLKKMATKYGETSNIYLEIEDCIEQFTLSDDTVDWPSRSVVILNKTLEKCRVLEEMKKQSLAEQKLRRLIRNEIKRIVENKRKPLKEGDYADAYENQAIKRLEKFEDLVPSQGAADTIEGEMVRAMQRIIYRCHNDGDVIGKGYGKETVTPSAKWLSGRKELRGIGTIFSTAAKAAVKKQYGSRRGDYDYDTISYMKALIPAFKMVSDYIESKKGNYTPNNGEDSR